MASPLKYRVTWTITVGKPNSGSRTVALEVPGLGEAVTLAKDVCLRADRERSSLSLTVATPAGGTLLEWHLGEDC